VIKVKEQLHLQLGTAKETHGTDYFSARKGFDPASTSFYDLVFEFKTVGQGMYENEFIERRIRL
jgi:hypothetical protein